MQENPNSRWAYRPSVASHTFCRSPGGPPAAATIVSPSRACSCIRPMTWPWVSSAPVSGTMSPKSAGIDARSNGVSGSSAAARTGSQLATAERTWSCHSCGVVYPAAATSSASAARARLASPTMPVAPRRWAS